MNHQKKNNKYIPVINRLKNTIKVILWTPKNQLPKEVTKNSAVSRSQQDICEDYIRNKIDSLKHLKLQGIKIKNKQKSPDLRITCTFSLHQKNKAKKHDWQIIDIE